MKTIILTIASAFLLAPSAHATEAYFTLGADHQSNDAQALYSSSSTRTSQGVGIAHGISDSIDITSEWLHTGYGADISVSDLQNLGQSRFMLDTLSLGARVSKTIGSYGRLFGSAGALGYTNGVHYTPDRSDLDAVGSLSSRKYGAGGQLALGAGLYGSVGKNRTTLFADFEVGYTLFTRPDHGALGLLSLSGASNRLRMGVKF
jgi:hypothetical protein